MLLLQHYKQERRLHAEPRTAISLVVLQNVSFTETDGRKNRIVWQSVDQSVIQ